MKYLAIKDYWKFQHYHTRGAPWIKLYAAVLSDAAFIQLPEAAQAQLMKIWVLASQFGHPLPNNPKLLAGKIGTTGRFQLAALVAAGFLIPCDECASNPLASDEQNASADASTTPAVASADASSTTRTGTRVPERRELENRDRNQNTSSSAGAAVGELGDRLPTDAGRVALMRLLDRVPNRVAWQAELSAMLDSMPGHVAATPAQLDEALREFDANGAAESPNMRHFRRYVERATRPPIVRSDRSNGRAARPGAPDYASAATDSEEKVKWQK